MKKIQFLALIFVGQVMWAQGDDSLRRTAVVNAIARSKDAVVNLSTMRVVPVKLNEDETGGRVKGLGTGFIVDPHGYVVTNYHVVEKVEQITAHMSNGKEYSARLVNFDEKGDLAVVKIDSQEKFPYLSLYGAGDAMLGETCIAIGNPWGLGSTVTTGIVSAVNRKLQLPNDEFFDDLIQTDASINPGNSGGPLFNIHGDLLGINVAIRTNARGIGFAIPTRKVRKALETLLGQPAMPISRVGLEVLEMDDQKDRSATSKDQVTLVRVDRVVPGSPAQKSGFLQGDEVIRVAGEDVRVRFDLHRALWDRKLGEPVTFTVRRNGRETRDITMTMSSPDGLSDTELLWQHLGVRVQSVAKERVQGVNKDWRGGLLLLEVVKGMAADRGGFRPGDILIGLHNWEMIDPNNVRYVLTLKDLAGHGPVQFILVRNGVERTGQIQLPSIP